MRWDTLMSRNPTVYAGLGSWAASILYNVRRPGSSWLSQPLGKDTLREKLFNRHAVKLAGCMSASDGEGKRS